MREGMGLYRGKRLDNGEWVEGDLLHPDIYGNGYSIEDFTKGKNNCFDVDPETIGQWTGLVDKNGVKVFEGDILKPSFDEKWKCLVQFKEGAFGVKYMATYLTFCDFYGTDAMFEVIGNIHDKAVNKDG